MPDLTNWVRSGVDAEEPLDNESYIIFSSRRAGGLGNSDLFVSFRQKDGTLAEPVNLGASINTDQHEFCPIVTPDGKYLFSSRRWGLPGRTDCWRRVLGGVRVLDQFRR
ncbi:MAG: PD40 domain-containing protein [Acidobacteria bacterium]|nr:PD40 domain-containing protein [Acidobacteriota bacterium]